MLGRLKKMILHLLAFSDSGLTEQCTWKNISLRIASVLDWNAYFSVPNVNMAKISGLSLCPI